MNKFLFILGIFLSFTVDAKQNVESHDVIKQKIIKESIEAYPGNCPCPYNTASNGSRCGKRSAYNRAGGSAPICYPEDITTQMINEYKNR